MGTGERGKKTSYDFWLFRNYSGEIIYNKGTLRKRVNPNLSPKISHEGTGHTEDTEE